MNLWGALRRRILPSRAPLLNIAADEGDGPVIIFLHGIASSAATFAHVIPQLSDHYRCISFDLLGFGESPSPADSNYTIEDHVDSIRSTVHSLKLDAPFILVGHSLGSLLAARYAAAHPSKVSRLVLVSPPIYVPPNQIGDPLIRARVGAYMRAYEFLRTNKEFTMNTVDTLRRLFQLDDILDVSEHNWRAFGLSLQNCIETQTTVSDIAAVRVPIDVVYGSLDQFIAPGTMRIIEQMRHVTMHRVEANDHLVRKRLAKRLVAVLDAGHELAEKQQ
ncbi:alpha/beta hydrolase [Salinibacterium sp. NSLL150]|uniref:alpha/beta fold hydrolase n=2 Tax=Salinibacterium TaxID=235888 RepID=UPI0018CE948F|nr:MULTISPECIES: alpha/beta hydrolase [unclassified Salinibacterium]MBH0099726.1 alpha/beta hydrolase [Salinibacterium sp. NSLL35]MBH0102480.1 alpha/beta hydrolase [Salinibacterium sp. NSLL150]MBH0105240.1 alpha/beta hydrolase [Salinibacterium sp. NSLL16]MBH0108000.1 alpha/beta hydrolase [Salinibacterium sp. NSLL17]